jgi:hypothetical protein
VRLPPKPEWNPFIHASLNKKRLAKWEALHVKVQQQKAAARKRYRANKRARVEQQLQSGTY